MMFIIRFIKLYLLMISIGCATKPANNQDFCILYEIASNDGYSITVIHDNIKECKKEVKFED